MKIKHNMGKDFNDSKGFFKISNHSRAEQMVFSLNLFISKGNMYQILYTVSCNFFPQYYKMSVENEATTC